MSLNIKEDLEILRKIKKCDDELYDLNFRYKEYKKNNLEIFDRIQSIEQSIKQVDEDILQLKTKINCNIKNIEQYKKNIITLDEDKNKAKDEKKIKEISEKIEIADLSLKVAEKEIGEFETDIKSKDQKKVLLLHDKENLSKVDVVKNIADIDNQISETNKNKKTFLKQLSSKIFEEYQKISYEDMRNKVLSNLERGFCDNCNLKATKQQELDMLEECFLVKCEYCGCIFVEIKK